MLVVLCVFGNISFMKAQSSDSYLKHRITLSGALTSSDTWQLDAAYHRMLLPYLGVGTSVGLWRQYGTDGIPMGEGWVVREENEKIHQFYLRPSVYFVSPAIWRISDARLHVFLEPGCMLSAPYDKLYVSLSGKRGQYMDYDKVSTKEGRWYAFDCKLGFNLTFGDAVLSVGYVCSNLDIFTMRRHMTYKEISFNDFYPEKKTLHGGFLSFSYCF